MFRQCYTDVSSESLYKYRNILLPKRNCTLYILQCIYPREGIPLKYDVFKTGEYPTVTPENFHHARLNNDRTSSRLGLIVQIPTRWLKPPPLG
jgi:hypothetical protein